MAEEKKSPQADEAAGVPSADPSPTVTDAASTAKTPETANAAAPSDAASAVKTTETTGAVGKDATDAAAPTDSPLSFDVPLPPPVELPSDLFAGLDDILKDLSATLGEDFLSSATPITSSTDPLAVTQELPHRKTSPVKASRTREKPPRFSRSKPQTATPARAGTRTAERTEGGTDRETTGGAGVVATPPAVASPIPSTTAKLPSVPPVPADSDSLPDTSPGSQPSPVDSDSPVEGVSPAVKKPGSLSEEEALVAALEAANPVQPPASGGEPVASGQPEQAGYEAGMPTGEANGEPSAPPTGQQPTHPAKRPTIRTLTHTHDSMEVQELEIDWQPPSQEPAQEPPEALEDEPSSPKKRRAREARRKRDKERERRRDTARNTTRETERDEEEDQAYPQGKTRPPLSAFFGHPKGQPEGEPFPEETGDGQPASPLLERVNDLARMRRREKTRQRRANAKRGMNATSRSYAAMTVADMRITVLRVILSIVLLGLGAAFKDASSTLYLVAYLTTAIPTVLTIGRNLTHGHYFDEYVLIFVASLGAFFLKHHAEASVILLIHCVGKLLCSLILLAAPEVETTQPDVSNTLAAVVNMQGEKRMLPPDQIQVGDFMMIESGEVIPVDGEILRGEGTVDQTSLTGEPEPIPVRKGSRLLAGSRYTGTRMLMRVVARYEDCALSRVQHMRSQAAAHRAGVEDSVLFSMSHYLPIVLAVALLLSIVPPLFHLDTVGTWLYRAFTVLIVCCPAALAASVPLSFANGIGRLAQKGIQVQGSEVIEKLADLRMVIFEKTGTLTEGNMKIKKILPAGDFNAQMCLTLAATAEQGSTHPIARAVLAAYQGKRQKVTNAEPQPGRGVKVQIGRHSLLAGNRKLMVSRGVRDVPELSGTVAYIALDTHYVGAILLEDTTRPEAAKAVAELKARGVVRTVVLTGDTEVPTQVVAEAVGIDTTHAGLTPEEKAVKIDFLLRTIPTDGTTAYVGTGDHDQEEMKRVDVGITTGFAPSQESVEAASVLLLSHNLLLLPDAVRISRLTYQVAMQNLLLLIGLKVILAALAIFGVATMWQAVAIDVLVTVLSILNAARVQKTR